MSLINNPYNQPDPQEAKVVCECEECDTEIYEGEEIIRYDDTVFCNVYCLVNYLDVIYDIAE